MMARPENRPPRTEGRAPNSGAPPAGDKANAFDKVRALIAVAQELTAILDRENLAIRQNDSARIRILLPEKNALTKTYEIRHKAVADDRTLLAHLDADRIADLREVALRLEDVVLENGRLLKASIDSGQYVLSAVTKAVKDAQATKITTYTSRGRMNAEHGYRTPTKPVALDQSL